MGNHKQLPSSKISTTLEWDDLVLHQDLMEQINEIKSWIKHEHTLMNDWQLDSKLKPGYRALFYGPSGTGKTLTAALLGKEANREVHRIDLSILSTRYIGETEKNLSEIFDIAQQNNWILFFDEADALFGKRTDVRSANDRHANQEVSYLLQRIENYSGVVILTSNFSNNIDEAFTRRFQVLMRFRMPSNAERHRLWTNIFSGRIQLHPDVNLKAIADRYEVTGGNIINVLRYAAIKAAERSEQIVTNEDLIKGIRKELVKEK